jgi:DNA (cytosine-5)-methyltransferase 1
VHTEESGPPRLIVPRRRRLAEIPSGNPLKHILERELLGRVAHRKRHGRHAVTVDYFCGAGGLTTGVERARERLRMPGYHYGINHDERAIQTISTNHHGTFVNSSVESIPVREIVREGYVTLFTGAAECIMHSTARRSDLPIYDQSRTSAAYMLEAIHDLPPEGIILENVPEWQNWSVLNTKTMRPVKGREGEYFRAFVKALRDMGYDIEWRVLNAADYGSCTSRRRLFLLGTADGRPVLWAMQTHAKNPEKYPGLNLRPWRASREIIDWDDLGSSLFNRDGGPHAIKSLRRMQTGFAEQSATLAQGYAAAIATFIPISAAFHGTRAPKFDLGPEDFKKNPTLDKYAKRPPKDKTVSPLTTAERVFVSNVWRAIYDLPRDKHELTKKERTAILRRGIDQSRSATRIAFSRPVATFTIDGDVARVETFALANRIHAAAHYTNRDPLPASTTATGGGLVHVAPLVLGQHEGGIAHNACTDPVPTIAAKGAIGAAEPRLIKMNASETSAFDDGTRSTEVPFGAIVAKTCIGLSTPTPPEAVLTEFYGTGGTTSLDEPVGNPSTHARFGLSTPMTPEPMVSAFYGDSNGRPRAPHTVSDPLGTQPTENRFGLLTGLTPEPVVTQDYGNSSPASVDSPLPSPTAHANKFGVLDPVTPEALLVTMNHGGSEDGRVSLPTHPLGAMTTKGSTGLAQPFIARQNGFFGEAAAERAIESTGDPLSPVSAGGQHHGLVSPTDPFILEQGYYGPDDPGIRSTDEAVPTITTISRIGLVNGYLLNRAGEAGDDRTVDDRSHDLEQPLPTATGSGAGYLVTPDLGSVEPFVSVNYGEAEKQKPRSYSTSEPLRTIVPLKGAGVLVRPGFDVSSTLKPWILVNGIPYAIDILFRMLKVIELAKAMGFVTDQHDYHFAGTETDQVRQIGNAVAVEPAEALAYVQLKPIAERYFGLRADEEIAA